MIVCIERLAIEACSMPLQELPMKKVLEHCTRGMILYCDHIVVVVFCDFYHPALHQHYYAKHPMVR